MIDSQKWLRDNTRSVLHASTRTLGALIGGEAERNRKDEMKQCIARHAPALDIDAVNELRKLAIGWAREFTVSDVEYRTKKRCSDELRAALADHRRQGG